MVGGKALKGAIQRIVSRPSFLVNIKWKSGWRDAPWRFWLKIPRVLMNENQKVNSSRT